MLKQRLRTFALAGVLTLAGALQILPAAATVQPSRSHFLCIAVTLDRAAVVRAGAVRSESII